MGSGESADSGVLPQRTENPSHFFPKAPEKKEYEPPKPKPKPVEASPFKPVFASNDPDEAPAQREPGASPFKPLIQ